MSGGAWAGAAVAAITGGYALCSRRLAPTPITSAMVFTGFGILVGPVGLDLLDLTHDAHIVLALVEAALALVLFTDAMTVRRRDLRSGGYVPARLLSVGLVLTVGAGWLLAWPLLPGLTMWELALVGAILTPTDAALGKTAITSASVPALVRNGLNVESGLNDGMVLPFFVLFLAALPGTSASQEGVAGVFWRVLLVSIAVGLAVGWCGGWLLAWSRAAGWVSPGWSQVFVLALAVGAYLPAVAWDGSGFMAAWAAGFAFALALRLNTPSPQRPPVQGAADFVEKLGELLGAASFLVFGAVLLGPALQHLSWRIVVYAVLSLTVVRMLPVALSLAGSGLRPPTVAYIGWFGPRGLASIVFGLLVVEEHVPGVQLLGRVVAVTVGLSVLLHGLSALPLSYRYGAWHRAASGTAQLREGESTAAAPHKRSVLDDPSP
ncbi:cation:proton antiporter [Streptomyces sp. SAS_276]|uniref:cation:proton antiporter n=1 Tax=Streptomyces sp. SAS_276 TaxID=3412745 RepID=UPI00403D16D0